MQVFAQQMRMGTLHLQFFSSLYSIINSIEGPRKHLSNWVPQLLRPASPIQTIMAMNITNFNFIVKIVRNLFLSKPFPGFGLVFWSFCVQSYHYTHGWKIMLSRTGRKSLFQSEIQCVGIRFVSRMCELRVVLLAHHIAGWRDRTHGF